MSNAATRLFLEAAVVEIPSLQRQTITDRSGRFIFTDVPAGEHAVVARYLGLDLSRKNIAVAPEVRVSVDFVLTSAVYQMSEFVVTGEREGSAAAITEQRNAPNAKNVVAMDTPANGFDQCGPRHLSRQADDGESGLRVAGVSGGHTLLRCHESLQ